MPHVKNQRSVAASSAAKLQKPYYKGHRVLTLAEAARRKPPLPPEPEWEEELQRFEAEQPKRSVTRRASM